MSVSTRCYSLTSISFGFQSSNEKMLNITHYQRNANQNHCEVPFHTSQNGWDPKVPPPRHAHGDLTSLAPHERLPEILVVPREKTARALQLEETPETPPSSRAEGHLFLHGLESNPGSSLQTEARNPRGRLGFPGPTQGEG